MQLSFNKILLGVSLVGSALLFSACGAEVGYNGGGYGPDYYGADYVGGVYYGHPGFHGGSYVAHPPARSWHGGGGHPAAGGHPSGGGHPAGGGGGGHDARGH